MFFGNNLKYLTELKGLNQTKMLDAIGFKRTTWNGYVNEKSFPKFEDLIKIANYFDIPEGDLIHLDLQNVEVNKKFIFKNVSKNVEVNVEPNVEVNAKKPPKGACIECEKKDIIIKGNMLLLQSNTKLIHSQEAQIQLLQNQQDTMKIQLQERERNQQPQHKERKTA